MAKIAEILSIFLWLRTVHLVQVDTFQMTRVLDLDLVTSATHRLEEVRCEFYCMLTCLSDGSCNSATFKGDTNMCEMYGDFFTTTNSGFCNNCVLLQVNQPIGPQWDIIFRFRAGSGHQVYSSWMSNIGIGLPEYKTVSSDEIEMWKSPVAVPTRWHEVSKVKLSVYTGGVEMMWMVFDTSSTNIENWFQQTKLIASSYDDIIGYSSITDFEIEGETSFGMERRFYVVDSGIGCSVDDGWFMVLDASHAGGCGYDSGRQSPAILYSPSTTITAASG